MTKEFAEAYQESLRLAAGEQPDLQKALASINQALRKHPEHEEALQVKSNIEALIEEEARAAQAAAQRRFPAEAFEAATRDTTHAEFFETHRWEFRRPLATVREALLRTFGNTDPAWEIKQQSAPNHDSVLFHCEPKGLLNTSGRRCTVLAAQVSGIEVHVYAKFWDYARGKTTRFSFLSGVDRESLTPIHSRFFPRGQKQAVEARRNQLPENFHQTLLQQLR